MTALIKNSVSRASFLRRLRAKAFSQVYAPNMGESRQDSESENWLGGDGWVSVDQENIETK